MFYFFNHEFNLPIWLGLLYAFFSALAFTLLGYPKYIKKLKLLSFGQSIRTDGPKSHLKKQGTPTMGGLLLIFATLLSTLIWCDLSKPKVLIVCFIAFGFSAIGFFDDWRKIKKKNTVGLSARAKMILQITMSFLAIYAYYFFLKADFSPSLNLPGLFSFSLPIGLYFLATIFITVGTSNAVNLTDGLDGLAIVPVIISAFCFLLFFLTSSKAEPEMAIFCAALIGSSIGFFWHNAYPASIFMGDTGSLSLGAILAMLAIFSHNELLSALLHGVFLLEALSVILQVLSFKTTRKRIFRMAPLHHHFELMGWPEPKVIARFWILALILAFTTTALRVYL